jgi:hypothetical protein
MPKGVFMNLNFIGVCVKYDVKLTKNKKEYADVILRDASGKLYPCKLWDWSSDLKEYFFPNRYVLVADLEENSYQGSVQYIIKDISVSKDTNIKDYVNDYIDTDAQFVEYTDLINSELNGSWWNKLINHIVKNNEVVLQSGVVDGRIGGNTHGSLMRSILRATKMSKGVASTTTLPIDYGFMYYLILMNYLSKGNMYSVSDDGQVKLSDNVNVFGYIGIPIVMVQKYFTSEELKDAPPSIKTLALQGILSGVSTGSLDSYPAIINNTAEGRIAYHCMTVDYTTSIMEFYYHGNVDDFMLSIPELNDKIKFIIPSRMTNN